MLKLENESNPLLQAIECKALFKIIYQIRGNLEHAQKAPSRETDLELCATSWPLVAEVVAKDTAHVDEFRCAPTALHRTVQAAHGEIPALYPPKSLDLKSLLMITWATFTGWIDFFYGNK